MSQLTSVVDSLESKLKKLIEAYSEIKLEKQQASETLTQLKEQNLSLLRELESCKKSCEDLKMANTILGGDQYKRETKLKINALVRDIEYCIAHIVS